jgi:hypothetical protein
VRREDVSTVERVGNLLIGLASKASHYGLSILFESHRCQNTTSKIADNIGKDDHCTDEDMPSSKFTTTVSRPNTSKATASIKPKAKKGQNETRYSQWPRCLGEPGHRGRPGHQPMNGGERAASR